MTTFAGIDLAWTAHRASGICILVGGSDGLRCERLEATLVDLARLARELAGRATLVAAIDAPLLVGPLRRAERELGRHFGKYKASAHSANEALLVSTGRNAGPELGRILAAAGVSLDPVALTRQAAGRHAFECYPHAQHVVLFGLDARIPYKRKKGRNTAFVREQLGVLQGYLSATVARECPSLVHDGPVAALLRVDPQTLRGAALKALEDQLDALTCALAAYLAWRDGLTAKDVLGDPATGYVAIPGLSRDPRFRLTSGPAPTSP